MTDSGSKVRTWPASVNFDEVTQSYNVRAMSGVQVFHSGVTRAIAEQACDAINQHFDWGREA